MAGTGWVMPALAVFLSRSGAWVVAAGLVLLIVCTSYDYAVSHHWIHPLLNVTGLLDLGLIGLLVSMSILITSDFVRANHALELKIVQMHRDAEKALQDEKVNQGLRIERIQAEVDRRRKDFEQAKEREVDAIRKTLVVAEEHHKEMKGRLIRVEGNSLLGKLAGGIARDVGMPFEGSGARGRWS